MDYIRSISEMNNINKEAYKWGWNDGYTSGLANARDYLNINDEDLGDLWEEVTKTEMDMVNKMEDQGFTVEQWTTIAVMIGKRLAEREKELVESLDAIEKELIQAKETIMQLQTEFDV